jgi:hypothetical protein
MLVVGCSGVLLARCRAAAAATGIDIEPVGPLSLAAIAAKMRPLVVLIAADLYRFDPAELDEVVRSVGANRMVVDLTESQERIEERLGEAVDEILVLRTEGATRRSSPDSRQPGSGIRWAAVAMPRRLH